MKPPEDPNEHSAYFRALCHRLLRGESDAFVLSLTPAGLAGQYLARDEYPDAVDEAVAREECARVLRDEYAFRGIEGDVHESIHRE